MRNAFVILILTIAAWLYTRHRVSAQGTYPIKILQTVPRGLKHAGQPIIDRQLVSALAPELPVATIILLLEHIAISKCKQPISNAASCVTYDAYIAFGRINGYKINPNQELIAIGVTNTIGSVFSAYPGALILFSAISSYRFLSSF
jgi:solute carrier family 26 (sodium-independent sulfate anion transporter), member 11